MSAIPVKIEWDKIPEADHYVVYYQPEGDDFTEVETVETSIVLHLPERRFTLVYVSYREGQLENIASEEMAIYPTRWNS